MDIEKSDVEWLIMFLVAIWPDIKKAFNKVKNKMKKPSRKRRRKKR